MSMLVYFSTKSEYTHRFIQKLGIENSRIPINAKEFLIAEKPFVLVVPTYCDTAGKGAVPQQVLNFLDHEENRRNIRGVIAAGNTNFGAQYAIAGNVIKRDYGVPFLYRFELMGTTEDVANVQNGLESFWKR
ncbi:class Ib ribonucleoside-diphosphate reductase assembly flavoprotein NrdI [Mesorhizobium sp. SP-1A]|uniref:class Ib ribonucleoside-diphosphate reductase assembly flavoprotein NrdI n=1 Tax=Mesorhizobium sp. SP-1A TaxID=3077840 RepID=UPI0028F7212E|nr:class Ib ribonucleoside-diphosphate reductase assembly flavoprotein NrdI [Mesorhizobium sp. SP-1A]